MSPKSLAKPGRSPRRAALARGRGAIIRPAPASRVTTPTLAGTFVKAVSGTAAILAGVRCGEEEIG